PQATKSNTLLINTMAAFAFTNCPTAAVFGRSGYNKDGDDDKDEKKCFGRSGYNKDGDDDDDKQKCFGRSGYNKGGKNDDDDEQ
ncbi:Protein MAK16, partial [Pestalotiopsis sp. IQ-011]